jgi:hypothetical protein
MAVQRGRRFDVLFDEMSPQVQATGTGPADPAGNSKPSGVGRSGSVSAQGEQKVA